MFSCDVTPVLCAKTISRMTEETIVSEIQQHSPRERGGGGKSHAAALLERGVTRSDSDPASERHNNDVAVGHVWQHLTSIRFIPKQRVGITREPRCFCVSHSPRLDS